MNHSDNYAKLQEQQMRKFIDLKQWLYEGNAKYDHLQVVNFKQGYRGVISHKAIQKQRIIFIPRNRVITLQLAKSDHICVDVIKNKTQLLSPKHTYLAIYLLQETHKQNQSVWKHYISLLPKEQHIFPIHYTKEQLTELNGSPFLFQIHERVLDIKRDYDKVFVLVAAFRKYSFFDFCWARTMVGSRMFGVHIDGVKTNILAPFADMLNHKLPKQTSWNFVQQQQGFCIQSLSQIKQGVEIYDSYGKKCNSRYLLNYGFVIQNNQLNQICLKINIDGPFQQKKLEMIKKIDGYRILKISVNMCENNFYEAMGHLRFKSISDFNQLAVLEKISGIKITNDPYVPAKTPPMTIQLELATWKQLKEICQSSLKQYATTIEEDQKLLQCQSLTYNMRNIIILRLGQKKLYSFYVKIAQKALNILSKDYVECLQEIMNIKEGWAKYISKMLSMMPHQKKKQVSHLFVEQKQQLEGPKSQQELQDL